MENRFDYVKYNDRSIRAQMALKEQFHALELMVEENLPAGRAKSLVMTKLEEAYMWVGKGIRDQQIAETGADLQEGRGDE